MERKKAIYKLIDSNEVIVYIGQTYDPAYRLIQHTSLKEYKNFNFNGRFKGRTDIRLEIIEWIDAKNAVKREAELQIEYGFKTEKQKMWDTINADPEKKKLRDIKRKTTVDSDPEKKKLAGIRHWETINSIPGKKEEIYAKLSETSKNKTTEEKRLKGLKSWETRRKNKENQQKVE